MSPGKYTLPGQRDKIGGGLQGRKGVLAVEKRKHPRYRVEFALEYSRAEGKTTFNGGLTADASEGGLLIDSRIEMPVGTKITLELLFPKGFELNNFEAEVEIVRKQDGSEDETFQYGIRFTRLSYDGQMKLQQLLSGRLQKGVGTAVRSGFVNFELRRHPRYSVDLPVQCYKLNSPVSHSGRAVNASEGGLLLYLPEKVEIGQHLKLVLSAGSKSALDTLEMTVQVVWIDIGFLMATEEYRVGVMIVDISSTDRLKLKDLLESLSE